MNSLKTWLAIIFGVAFLRIGLLHFTQPEPFDAIIPPYLPFPRFWTLASGILEILFGLGTDAPKDAPEGCALYGFITGVDVSGQPQHVGS